MRQMIAHPSHGSICQFRCTHCDWVFHVQQPLTPEISLELQRSYAGRWFATHSCGELLPGRNAIFSKRAQRSPETGQGPAA